MQIDTMTEVREGGEVIVHGGYVNTWCETSDPRRGFVRRTGSHNDLTCPECQTFFVVRAMGLST